MAQSFFERSKHRKLFQWAIAYLAAAWLLLQLLDLLSEPFRLPDVVLRSATVFLAIGFLAAIVVAWYHGEKGAQRVTAREVGLVGVIVVIAGGAVVMVGGGSQREAKRGIQPLAPVAGIEQSSIAVLPFVNMSGDAQQEYFSDGLTEELLNVLAQIAGLRVASRTSSFAYKGSKVTVDSIGRALKVAHVLEGSVRRAGDRVRITAQLIRADNGYHLWSRTYNLSLTDVFAIQDTISHAIVDALAPRLVARGDTLARQETRDAEAHSLMLKGAFLAQQGTREDYERAAKLLQEAIQRDPTYARAHAELARVYSQQAYLHFGPRALVQKARAAADRALKLDSALAQAHYARADIARLHDWDFRTAETHFRRAIELQPGLAAPHSTHGWLLAELGQRDDAVAEAKRAVAADPVSPGMLGNLAAIYTLTEQFAPAIEIYESALEVEPNDPINLGNAALTYSYMDRHREAVVAAERALALAANDQFILAVAGYVYGRAGRRADAQRTIQKLEAQAEASPYLLATAYAGVGARDRVISLLEHIVAIKDPAAPDLGVDPTFREYRSDPRVRKLLASMGLPYIPPAATR